MEKADAAEEIVNNFHSLKSAKDPGVWFKTTLFLVLRARRGVRGVRSVERGKFSEFARKRYSGYQSFYAFQLGRNAFFQQLF